jgi:hypothetical protein
VPKWVKGQKIAEALDVSTHACSICREPARVPEDVVAVFRKRGKTLPLVVCMDCGPSFLTFLEDVRRMFNDAEDEA